MFEFLRKIMQDVVVEPMPTTTAAVDGNVEGAMQKPALWILLVLLLVVIVLCFAFILNNKRKKKSEEAAIDEDEKGSR